MKIIYAPSALLYCFLICIPFCSPTHLLGQDSLEYNWTNILGGTFNEQIFESTVNSDGQLSFIGTFFSTVLPIPTQPPVIIERKGAEDVISMSYDLAGDIQGFSAFGGKSVDYGTAIWTDNDDNVLMTGYFSDTLIIIADSTPVDTFVPVRWQDIFCLKLNKDGDYQWGRTFGGMEREHGSDIVADADGNVYVFGDFKDSVDFDPGPGTNWIAPKIGSHAQFISKFDPDGNYQWTKVWENGINISIGSQNSFRDLKIDEQGNFYIAGDFRDSLDIDPDSSSYVLHSREDQNGFIAKFSPDLDSLLWVLSFGGNAASSVREIEIDQAGHVFAIGQFTDTIDFDPGAGTSIHISSGNPDAFLLKFDSEGQLTWDHTFGSYPGPYDIIYSLDIDSAANIYVVGEFTDSIQLDPAGIEAPLHDSFGDIFSPDMTAVVPLTSRLISGQAQLGEFTYMSQSIST